MNLSDAQVSALIDYALKRLPERVHGQYEQMQEELKMAVVQSYERHERACRACDVHPDPNFLVELINELAAGRKDSVNC